MQYFAESIFCCDRFSLCFRCVRKKNSTQTMHLACRIANRAQMQFHFYSSCLRDFMSSGHYYLLQVSTIYCHLTVCRSVGIQSLRLSIYFARLWRDDSFGHLASLGIQIKVKCRYRKIVSISNQLMEISIVRRIVKVLYALWAIQCLTDVRMTCDAIQSCAHPSAWYANAFKCMQMEYHRMHEFI